MAEMSVDTPITLEHSEFVNYAFAHWLWCLENKVPPKTMCLLGPPGIGKSAAAYDICARMTAYVREHPEIIFGDQTPPIKEDIVAVTELLDFTSKMPEDLGGLPFRSADGFTDYCPQRWVAKLCEPHAFGVYVQDDLPAAPNAMQVAGRQAALERRIHEHRFSPGILVMVTGNRREDRAKAGTLPSHFRNSITLISIEPSLDEWKRWYGKQPGADPVVPAFLTWRPELLSETPGDSKDRLGAFATPRQWFNLGQQFAAAKACSMNVLHAVAAGLVGAGTGLEFMGYVEIRSELPDPEQMLDDPKGMMPNPRKELDEPSKRCAMATALGERAAVRWKKLDGAARDAAPIKLLQALAWTADAGDEYSAIGVQTFLDQGGNLTALARMARSARNDPVIGRLMSHVHRAMLHDDDGDDN